MISSAFFLLYQEPLWVLKSLKDLVYMLNFFLQVVIITNPERSKEKADTYTAFDAVCMSRIKMHVIFFIGRLPENLLHGLA